MSEQQKILEMIEKGQITAAEAMELLDALKMTAGSQTIQDVKSVSTERGNYKFLKVKVTSDNNSVNVNVNVPIRLLTTISEIADKMTTVIPADARKAMEDKGVDISNIDFAKIIEEILNGTLEDPNIVDVEVWDEGHKAMIKVRVYVD